jgi:hypothetical protein
MKPVDINIADGNNLIIENLNILMEDIYKKFNSLDTNIYDFVTEEPIPQQAITSIDSDETDADIMAHETTYNHSNLHSKQHAIDEATDHTSTITENNLMDADANGLPDDSGLAVGDLALKILTTDRYTSNQTLTASNHVIVGDTDGGTFIITLPAGIDGTPYKISNVGSSGNALTTVPDGAELLVGDNASFDLLDGETLDLCYETTEGWIA